MESYNVLDKVALFNGIEGYELDGLLRCLNRTFKAYDKGNYIISEGDAVKSIGIVLSGRVQVQKQDVFGRQVIMTELASTDIFGEVFAFSGTKTYPVYVQAITDCEIMFVDYSGIIEFCHSACDFHKRLVSNMLTILAKKSMFFNQKVDILSKRTIRERLFTFLEAQMKNQGSKQFTIYYSREGLAEFLCVDRSALSRELGKMQDEGLLKFDRKYFHVLKAFDY